MAVTIDSRNESAAASSGSTAVRGIVDGGSESESASPRVTWRLQRRPRHLCTTVCCQHAILLENRRLARLQRIKS